MPTKKINKDVFENVIDIGLRMYGNGYPYPKNIVELITEYCRQQVANYFSKHFQFINKNNRITYLHTLVYNFRHKKSSLKRLQQFTQAKDRPTSQQDEIMENIEKDKKISINQRFKRICHQLQIQISNNKVNQFYYKISILFFSCPLCSHQY